MKSVRHAVIKEIIESQDIETQEELAAALRARNIDVTQATVSRDIKELRLLKVLSIVPASNLIVIKTISGSAHAAGEAIDTLHWPEIVGTISGDNTLLIIAQNAEDVEVLMQKIEQMRARK